jgi:hypothetical protein
MTKWLQQASIDNLTNKIFASLLIWVLMTRSKLVKHYLARTIIAMHHPSVDENDIAEDATIPTMQEAHLLVLGTSCASPSPHWGSSGYSLFLSEELKVVNEWGEGLSPHFDVICRVAWTFKSNYAILRPFGYHMLILIIIVDFRAYWEPL